MPVMNMILNIDNTTNVYEAGLGWITKLKKGNFIGRDALLKVKEDGPKKKLCAMISDAKAFPRKDYTISLNGHAIGKITSGTVSPILEKPIALGYIEKEHAVIGNRVNLNIRNKEISAEIVKLPFVKK